MRFGRLLEWSCFPGGESASCTWDVPLGCWTFRAPQGLVQLYGYDPEYVDAYERLTLQPGTKEFVLRMQPLVRLTLRLRDGAQTLAWHPVRCAWLETRADERAGESEIDSDGLLLRCEPGDYVLFVPDQPGYERVPPQTLHLEHDVALEIALVRRP